MNTETVTQADLQVSLAHPGNFVRVYDKGEQSDIIECICLEKPPQKTKTWGKELSRFVVNMYPDTTAFRMMTLGTDLPLVVILGVMIFASGYHKNPAPVSCGPFRSGRVDLQLLLRFL